MKNIPLFQSLWLVAIRSAGVFSIFSALTGWAGNNWDGGGTNNLTSTAANWDADTVPGGGAALTFGSVSPIGTTVVWDFANGFNPNTITFPSGALGYTINDPAAPTTIQIVQGSGGGVYNNSGNVQTLNKVVHVFFNGTKQFDANTANLVLGKDVGFRADSMGNPSTNTLSLRGSYDGTISGGVINGSGPGTGVGYVLSKDGTGRWTLAGSGNFTGNARITAGTLQLNHATALQSCTLDMNAADAGTLAFGSALTATTVGGLQGSRNIVLTNTIGNAVTLSVGNNNANTVYTGILSGTGSGGLTKVGTGSLTLSVDATGFGGAATLLVSGGSLICNGNLGGLASGTVASGATLQPNAAVTYGNFPLTITGSGASGLGALYFNSGSTTTATWPGTITLGSGGAAIGSFGVAYNTTLSGAIGGTGPLTIQGRGGNNASHTGIFTLSTACNYTGNTTLKNNDGEANTTLKIGVNDTLPTATVLTLGIANSLAATGVTFDLNGKNQQLAGLAKDAVAASTKYRVLNSAAGASTLTINNSSSATFDGLIGISGSTNISLVKQGLAAFTLGGTNAYFGGTTISNGTLFVNGSIPGAVTVSGGTLAGSGTVTGSVTVASGGGLNPGGSAGSAGTLTVQGGLTLAPGGTATFDLASTATVGGGVNDLVQLTGGASGNLTLNGNAVTVNILAPLATGTNYTIMTFTGTRTGTIGTVSGVGRQPVTVNYDDTPGAGKVTLTFGASASAALIWNSVSSGVWDVMTTANWTNTASLLSPDVFYQFDNVTFNDTPGVQTGITLGTTVNPNSVTVNSSANAFSLSGSGKISGYATLTKNGSSTFTVNNTNDYTGATTVNGGRLLLSGGANRLPPVTAVTLANTSGDILDLNGNNQTVASLSGGGASGGNVTLGAGVLTVAGTGTATYQGIISGSGSLAKSGIGTQTLANANSYSGGTTVSAGVLAVSGGGTLGTNTAALNANGGTLDLGGTSQTAGAVTIAGGTVAGGTLTGSSFAGQSGTVSATLAGIGTVLTKTGAGTLVLSGTNVFTGGTIMSAGSLLLSSPGVSLPGDITLNGGNVQLGAAEQIADAAVMSFTNAAEARLQLQGFNETIGGVQSLGGAGTRILEAASDYYGYRPATLALNVGGAAAYTFDGYVRDAASTNNSPLSITKSGTGTQTFSGSPSWVSYTGATVINGGVLEFSGAGSVANTSAITFNGGSVKFSGGGTRSALINGAGNVICAAGTALTLSGTNSYTGSTTIGSNCTLTVNSLTNSGVNSPIGAATSAASNLVFDASTLSYTGPTASSDRSFTISAAKVATVIVTLTGTNLTLTGSAPATTGYLKKTGNGILTLAPASGGYTLGALSADGGPLVLKSGTFATTGADPAVPGYGVGIGARGGTLTVDGATVNAPASQSFKVGASANANLNILSGTVTAADIVVGHNGTVIGTQSGGDVNAAYLWHYDGGWATYTLTGGTLTTKRIYNYTLSVGATFTLLLNGGIVRAAAGTANLMDNGGRTNTLDLIVQLGSVGATIDTSLSNATIVRPLDDIPGQAGRLTKIGSGTLTLTGTNTYSGATIVSNGVLRVTGAQVLPAAADVYLSSGATLLLDYTGTTTIRRLYIDGELMTVNVAYGAARRPSVLSGTGYLLTSEGAQPKGSMVLLR